MNQHWFFLKIDYQWISIFKESVWLLDELGFLDRNLDLAHFEDFRPLDQLELG